VADVLHRRGQLEKIGGSPYLAELSESAVTTANITYHARLVRDKALLRELINISSNMRASAYEQADIQEVISRATESLLHVSHAQAVSAFATLHTLVLASVHEAERARAHEEIGLPTGFHALDYLLNGFQPTDLIILAARPGMGKTSLGLQFAMAAAKHPPRLPVAVFSLEMSKQQLSMRMMCAEARVDSSRVRRGFVEGHEWAQLMNGADRLYDLPILVDDAPNVSVLEIRARLKRLQMLGHDLRSDRDARAAQHGGLAMVIIDYLQLIAPARRKESRQQEVSDISRDLKILAKELGVPVIALSQLSRKIEERGDKIPVLSDLRDSGAIEQDADVIMFLYHPEQSDPHNGDQLTHLIVAKHRNGPTGEVPLIFRATYTRFDPLATSHHHAMAS
jgi:replicative DNA helicase